MPYKFYILDGTGTTRQKHTFSSTATEKPNAGQHLNFPLLAFQGLTIWLESQLRGNADLLKLWVS